MQRRSFFALSGAAVLAAMIPLPGWSAVADNPLLQTWTGPYGGVPAFDKYKPGHFNEAFQAATEENRREIQAIANNPEPPTFQNTLEALEDAGRNYNRVSTLFGVYTSTFNTPEVQKIEQEWAPKFAAFSDEIVQNEKLFKRIEAVYNTRQGLDPEQQRLSWLYFTNFVRSGARLNPEQKKVLSGYNQKLAELYTNFSQNVLKDEETDVLVLEKKEDLAGLPQSFQDSLKAAAERKGHKGKWVLINTRSAVEPFLSNSDRRDLREKAFKMWTSRGDKGGPTDNNPNIAEILLLRAKRAKLLGFPTHAHWRLENAMARTPDKAMELMKKVWPAAVARAKEEVADMAKLAGHAIEPWDYRYYAEKVRKQRYDLDEAEIKPYMQLQKLRDGMFWCANQLYGFEFKEITNVPKAHPDIRTWEVTKNGNLVGLWYWDPYAREGKSSGAWMNEYRTQERFKREIQPIVSNNSNYVKGPDLISWDDAETMFHEFGHALHGLNSNVRYPSLAGTNVARDFVEFPSQVNEHWLSTPEVLNRFALHHQTGKPMPAELVEKIQRAAKFNMGFTTVEYLASAILDMELHLLGEQRVDARRFEKEALTRLGMPREIVMRHRLPHFNHVFSGDGYSAGYYSYLWSEVLDQDAWQAFLEAGGPFDKTVAERYRKEIMSVGNTIEPAEAYRRFRGRDPQIGPLLKARGFPEA